MYDGEIDAYQLKREKNNFWGGIKNAEQVEYFYFCFLFKVNVICHEQTFLGELPL